jgi:glycine/D-amino acid oxidase-like deaminating enzyme
MSAVHVVGAGVAGLVCALRLADAGRRVVLHEATPGAGGRCRSLPDGGDNGTHALVGGNRAALRFLDRVGAREGWVEPEPEGLPVLDLLTGRAARVSLSPLGWTAAGLRPAGVSLGALLALARCALPGRDRPVAEVMARHPEFHRGFVEPLTVAALNTPAAEASSRRLGAVLLRAGGRAGARLLVAREGLGPDLVRPALEALRGAGAEVRFGSRLRRIAVEGGRVAALEFEGGAVPLGDGGGAAAVLAVPPWEASRLLPGLAVPEAHAPIVNLHFAHETPGAPVRFLGLLGALCQWVLVRPGGVSVTVSAGDAEAREDASTLAPRAWAELRRAASAFGLPGAWPEAPAPCRVVKERRATPRHLPGAPPRPPRRPLPNLALAGDWTYPALPATIEASVLSGEAAARAVLRS